MKIRNIFAAAAAAAALAAPVLAVSPASASSALPPGLAAAHVPSSLGPGWTAVYWAAESGGGYADPASQAPGQPVVSEPGAFLWEARELGTVPNHGQQWELVNPAGTLAVTFSGGWVMARPDSRSTYLVFDTAGGCSGSWCLVSSRTFSNYAVPNGAGHQLKAPGRATLPAGGWRREAS